MFMYGTDLLFWVNLIILLSGISLLFLTFNAGMRKWLNLKKKPWFTNDYVNETHKKIDSFLQFTFLGLLALSVLVTAYNGREPTKQPAELTWLHSPLIIPLGYYFLVESVRAVMEWKYASHPKACLYTVSQMFFFAAILFLMFMTDFFGLL